MASSKTTTPSEEVINERNLRKRIAARVRQQRCRARKREAKLAKAQREAKAPRPGMIHQQVVRGPVLIRSPPRMTVPLMHHPTSPFIMYPRRTTNIFPPSPPGNGMWVRPLQQAQNPSTSSPPITSIPFPGSNRPLHHEIMKGSALALGICRSPTVTQPMRSPPNLHIPRVSPVAESCKKVPMLPELDLLDRKEEAAIDAMLSLHRSPSKVSEPSSFVPVGV